MGTTPSFAPLVSILGQFLGTETGSVTAPAALLEHLMPVFYFHTQTDTRTSDDVGTELPGPVEARREAIRTCGEMIRDCAEGFWGSRPWTVTVTNAAGLVLWEISVDGNATPASG